MRSRKPTKTRSLELSSRLRVLAHERGPGAKLPTVQEIVQLYGISQSTINDALATLEADNVVERRRGSGIYVSPLLHHKTIAIVFDPDFFHRGVSPFWSMLWGLMFTEAQQRSLAVGRTFSFHLALPWEHGANQLQPSLREQVEHRRIHGVIHIGLYPATAAWLMHHHVPVVAYSGYGDCMVAHSHEEQVRLSVEALVAQGCTRIGLWQPVPQFRPINAPFEYDAALLPRQLAAAGVPFFPELVRNNLHLLQPAHGHYRQTQETNQEQGYRTATEVFGATDCAPPDGIVITDDMMTSGVLVALHKRGIRVGQDVRIASHTNRHSPVLFGHEDALTLIEVDPEEIVRALFTHLDRLLATDAVVPRYDVPVRLCQPLVLE